MKNKNIMVIAILAILCFSAVLGYQGNMELKRENYNEERHEIMQEIFENSDYEAWKEQMQGRNIVNKINEENFEIFLELRDARKNNNFEKVEMLREVLNLNQQKKGRNK